MSDPKRDLIATHIPVGARRGDVNAVSGVFAVEQFICASGERFISSAGETREDGIVNEATAQRGEPIPRALGDVTEGTAYRDEASLKVDFEDAFVHAVKGSLSVETGDQMHGLTGKVRETCGVARGLHFVFIVENGEAAFGNSAASEGG